MKKLSFLFLVFFIAGYYLSWQVNNIIRQDEISNLDQLDDTSNDTLDRDRFILVDEDLVSTDNLIENVEKKSQKVNTVVKKDLESITAESYIVGNLDTGKIYLQYNPDKVYPIASLSKFFTALMVNHLFDNTRTVNITQKVLDTYGDAGHLVLGEKYNPKDLLYPLLLESSNDAAVALAESYGNVKFMKAMNDLALEIGMNHTSFVDPSGLSAKNISNTNDLFLLAQYYYKNEKDLLSLTKNKSFELATTSDHGFHIFLSNNPFVEYEPFIGGKTGRTLEAKESMISMFNMKIGHNNYPIAVIILRSNMGEREIDTEKIMEKTEKTITKK